MTKYPIGIQSFASLRKDGFAYVDKTPFIYRLANEGRYYFLSRPRRFGKSLLLSTMESYFLGEKELFKGLALEQLEKEWAVRPVLYLDLNSGDYTNEGDLATTLNTTLSLWEERYGRNPIEDTFPSRFMGIIRRAQEQTGHRVAILVDEYDKPMLQTIDNEALADKHRRTLKAFYSVMKTMDKYIRFAFLTGVTKFSKISVFSDLNNLKDISMDERYVEICGLTEKEISDNFEEGITHLAQQNELTREECMATLRRRYDGYHFEVGTIGMYNPFSVLNTLDRGAFRNYWFETGTPTFLVEVMKHCDYPLGDLQKGAIDVDTLTSVDPMEKSPIPVIYQAGYLTLKSYDPIDHLYTLDFPNEEVREGFLRFLIPYYTPQPKANGADYVSKMRRAAQGGEAEEMMQLLQDFFDEGDYRVAGKAELYFQNAMYVIFRLLGLYTQVEMATARGRIDLAVETPKYVYIIEIKLDGTPEEALQQIEDKGYARKYASDERTLYKVGVNFASKTRDVEAWKTISQ